MADLPGATLRRVSMGAPLAPAPGRPAVHVQRQDLSFDVNGRTVRVDDFVTLASAPGETEMRVVQVWNWDRGFGTCCAGSKADAVELMK